MNNNNPEKTSSGAEQSPEEIGREIIQLFKDNGFVDCKSAAVTEGVIALHKGSLLVRIAPWKQASSGWELSFEHWMNIAEPDGLMLTIRKKLGLESRGIYNQEKTNPIAVLESTGRFKKGKSAGICSTGLTFSIEMA